MVWRNLINLRSVLIKLVVAVKWAQFTSSIIGNLRNLIVDYIGIPRCLFICFDCVFVKIFSTFPRLNRFLGFVWHITSMENRIFPFSPGLALELPIHVIEGRISDSDLYYALIDSLSLLSEISDRKIALAKSQPLIKVWLIWENDKILCHIYRFLFITHYLCTLQFSVTIFDVTVFTKVRMYLLSHRKFVHFHLFLIWFEEICLVFGHKLANSLRADDLQIFVHFRILVLGLVCVITGHSLVCDWHSIAILTIHTIWEEFCVLLWGFAVTMERIIYLR